MRLPLLCGLILLFLLQSVPLAAAGGSPTVAVSPNPVAEGQLFVVSGCGYTVGSLLWVRLQYPSLFGAFGFYPTAGADGCFALLPYSITDSSLTGTWHALVNYANRKGSKNSAASAAFLVTP